jgi:hypothetical protein
MAPEQLRPCKARRATECVRTVHTDRGSTASIKDMVMYNQYDNLLKLQRKLVMDAQLILAKLRVLQNLLFAYNDTEYTTSQNLMASKERTVGVVLTFVDLI